MLPRVVALVLLAALSMPQVSADPTVPPLDEEGVMGCITISWWPPPPYVVFGNCDKFSGMVYVNGTDAGYVP